MNASQFYESSLVLDNDKIMSISRQGILLSNSDGTTFSSIKHTNPQLDSRYSITKFTNGDVIGYNKKEILYYDNQGVKKYEFLTGISLSLATNVINPSCIATADDKNYLIATISENILRLYMYEAPHISIKNITYPINSENNVQCLKKYLNRLYVCSLILNDYSRSLSLYIIAEDGQIALLNKISTLKGRYNILKRIKNALYAIGYVTYESVIFCTFYDETIGFSPEIPIQVYSNTNFFDHHRIDIGIISNQQILFIYCVENMDIRIQKVSILGELLGPSINYPVSGYILALTYVSFKDGNHGIIYGFSPQNMYYQSLEIPHCSNYCHNVNLSSTTLLDFTFYSSTPIIQFISLPVFGKLEIDGKPIKIMSYYPRTSKIYYISINFPSIGSAHFVTVTDFGVSPQCTMNLFIGEKGKCKCPDKLYSFHNICVETCPSYTFSDSVNQHCINCASLGKYLYKGNCIDFPDSTYVTNKDYNVVEDCHISCKTCIDNTENCLTCQLSAPTCKLNCTEGFYQSTLTGTCEPCFESCKTCSEPIVPPYDNECDTCKEGYKSFIVRSFHCVQACDNPLTLRWYIDNSKEFHCISSIICPDFRPIYIPETNQCVESCAKTSTCLKCQGTIKLLYIFENSCVDKCPFGYIPNSKTTVCDKVPGIDIDISDKPLEDELEDVVPNLPDKNITIIKGDNYTVEIYNSTEDGGNLALSMIDFTKCERILRKQYMIPDGEILIFVKVDIDRETELTNQVEYEVYDSKRKKLNLSYCDETTIDVTYNIKNTTGIDIETAKEYEKLGIDIYNPNDPFFTDICFPFTTENGTDIILRDRLKNIYKNISLCEKSCSYKGVDLENLTVTCTCAVKKELNKEITPNFFIEGFTSVFTNSNFIVVTCSNLVFTSNIFKNNIGFWFYFVFMILHLPNWLYYIIIGVSPITGFINNKIKCSPPKKTDDYISNKIEEPHNPNYKQETLENIMKVRESRRNKRNMTVHSIRGGSITNKSPSFRNIPLFPMGNDNKPIHLFDQDIHHQDETIRIPKHILIENYSIKKTEEKSPISPDILLLKRNQKRNSINSLFHSNYIQQSTNNNTSKFDSLKLKKINPSENDKDLDKNSNKILLNQNPKKKSSVITTLPQYTNRESIENTLSSTIQVTKKTPSMDTLDDLTFKEAQKDDNRSFLRQVYICIKNKHQLFITFVRMNSLDLRCILIIVYFFENTMDFAFNAFFFTDDLISKRYNYEGNLGLLFTLQNNFITSLVSFLISFVIAFLLNLLSTSKGGFEQLLANNKDSKEAKVIFKKKLLCFKIKLIFYLILELCLILFFWYYVTAFCAVYQSSQWSWFTGGCMTFVLGLFIPIAVSFGIILMRYLALTHNKHCLFKFAQWLYKL